MVIEQEFFDWRRVQFAILAEQKIYFRFAIRLARRIQAENIGFVLLGACEGVPEGCAEETQNRNNQ